MWFYRHIIPPNSKNLAFVGHGIALNISVMTAISCVWVVEMLRGNVKLPTQEEMVKNVDAQ
jgi:hypothetical protein